jgi:hypothetical protein
MELMFDLLTAGEIECRVGTVKQPDPKKHTEGGISLLLYKDARCDMIRLDKAVGAMGWQRAHSRENANCTVSIWDDEKKVWVSKEDTGVASRTEAEKGLASDSFKRACVNWGIGRELYTAPFIWISGDPDKLKWERFKVKDISYDANRNINALVIVDKFGKEVFHKGVIEQVEPDTPDESTETKQPKRDAPADVKKVDSIPPVKEENPVKRYIANELTFMKQMFGIASTDEMMKKFAEMRKALIDAKIIEDVSSDSQTMEQAEFMIDAIYKNFSPVGNQVKVG